jgi:translocation and assembly module TamB
VAGSGSLRLDAARDRGTIDIRTFDLAMPGLSATAAGTVGRTQSALDLNARVANVAALVPGIAGPLTVNGRIGQNPAGALLADVTATGPGGIAADISGTYDIEANRADLRATGGLPLAVADFLIGSPSLRLRGPVRFDLAVVGPPALDSVRGTVSIRDSVVLLPDVPVRLEPVTADVAIAGKDINFDAALGVPAGGRVLVTGRTRIDPAAGIPATLQVAIRGARYQQRGLIETSASGDISLAGPLMGGANIAGQITLGETNITVAAPPPGGGKLASLKHENETRDQYLTRVRAGLVNSGSGTGTGASSSGGGGGPAFGLDLTISAPARVFIRGRGLDTELGGTLRIAGTTAAPTPSGGFELIRGRMNLLGRRLDITRAEARFVGGFVPELEIVAESRSANGVNTFVDITGPANDPEIRFRSDPELPEDQVLAEMLFGRPFDELSGFQLARLAGSIAELTGRGGDGLLGRIRNAAGVDDIDISTDADGNTTATAGKYLSENVYTSIGANSLGTTELQLNLDLSSSVTARGSVTSDSQSSLGLFFERDY